MLVAHHPSSVRFSPDGHDGDDLSELTGPSSPYYHWQDDHLLGNMATDLYCYHDFGGLLPSSPEKRELLQLKIQLARQQEKLDSLSLKLRECEDENEALEAEKKALADELALAIKKRTATKREERPTIKSKFKDNAGPIRQLVDFNAALTTENVRLQAIVDITRKSFKTHIRESRRRRDEDVKAIQALRLRWEDKLLQLHQGHPKGKNLRCSSSERTAKTSLRSSFTESVTDDSLRLDPVPEVNFGRLGDGCIVEGEEAENAYGSKRAPCACKKTMDCASGEDTKRTLATGPRAPGSTGRVEGSRGGAAGVPQTILFDKAWRSTAREWSNINW